VLKYGWEFEQLHLKGLTNIFFIVYKYWVSCSNTT
jgi:hypothetical protein